MRDKSKYLYLFSGHEVGHILLEHKPKMGPSLKCSNLNDDLCSEDYFEAYIEREVDADKTGMILAQNAGYDMYQNIDLLEKIITHLEKLEGTDHEIAVKQNKAKVLKIQEFLNTNGTSYAIGTNEPSLIVMKTIIFLLFMHI